MSWFDIYIGFVFGFIIGGGVTKIFIFNRLYKRPPTSNKRGQE